MHNWFQEPLSSGSNTPSQFYICDLKTASETDVEGPKSERQRERWKEINGEERLYLTLKFGGLPGVRNCFIQVLCNQCEEFAQGEAGPVSPVHWSDPIIPEAELPDPSTQPFCDLWPHPRKPRRGAHAVHCF